MTSTIYRYKLFGFLAFWFFGLVACGGGGGSSSQKPSDGGSPSNGNPAPNVSNNTLNPAFEGKFFYHNDDGPAYFFDIATGTVERIPNTYWPRESADRFPNSVASFRAKPALNGEYWSLTVDQCQLGISSGGCLHFQDKFGNYFGNSFNFEVEAESSLISPDGKYIAVGHNTLTGDNPWYQIYDLDGKNHASKDIEGISFDWLPDNSIVYTDEAVGLRQFQFTKPLSFDVEYLLKLPGQATGNGFIASFDPSPDGKYIAFKLKGEGEDIKSSLWVMEIETGALNRLGQVGRGIDTLGRPRWSPSGTYIAVLSGGGSGRIFPDSPNPDPDTLPPQDSMFIIPTEKMMSETYIISRFDDKSEEVTELRRLNDVGNVIRGFSMAGFSWVE